MVFASWSKASAFSARRCCNGASDLGDDRQYEHCGKHRLGGPHRSFAHDRSERSGPRVTSAAAGRFISASQL